ncbi:MAG: OmpA family protein [Hyphomonadaceae bacterium]|nr:OmpA family protein [Hyphomonadaceae bacterium]
MKKSITLTAIAATLVMAGCQQGPSNRTVGTTAGGAIVGAGLGTLAGGDDKRNAAIGAVVGGLAGAAVGVYMDEQERKLREATAGTGIEVARNGDQIALNMPSSITFDVNSAAIKPAFHGSLNNVATTLVEYPQTAVDVVGHASADGAADYNMRLSQQRAESVQAYLVGQGMRPVRLQAVGMGENQPTGLGYEADRRVEIILTPIVDETA